MSDSRRQLQHQSNCLWLFCFSGKAIRWDDIVVESPAKKTQQRL